MDRRLTSQLLLIKRPNINQRSLFSLLLPFLRLLSGRPPLVDRRQRQEAQTAAPMGFLWTVCRRLAPSCAFECARLATLSRKEQPNTH